MSGFAGLCQRPQRHFCFAAENLGQNRIPENFATPVQNNGSIYNVIYTYTKGPWTHPAVPLVHGYMPFNAKIVHLERCAIWPGGAILASYAFKHGFSLPVRYEYISSSGSVAQDTINLMYGPGSSGTSFTVTPTYRYGSGFFIRGDAAWVAPASFEKGAVFGPLGLNNNQFRAVAEVGFVFGNNIEKK